MANIVSKVDGDLPIRYVLASVSDKSGLETFVPELLETCPEVVFMSTGGTFKKIGEIMGPETAEKHLIAVESYTGIPEMQGGLVKTLTHKIHAGILGERHNPEHQQYLERFSEGCMNAVYIDMVVVNLYPFREVVQKIEDGENRPGTDIPMGFEDARANIDIGGPCMLRAAAKNHHSCAPVVNPSSYGQVLFELKKKGGKLSLPKRFELAREAIRHTRDYDMSIVAYWDKQDPSKVPNNYEIANPLGGR